MQYILQLKYVCVKQILTDMLSDLHRYSGFVLLKVILELLLNILAPEHLDYFNKSLANLQEVSDLRIQFWHASNHNHHL